MSIRNSKTVIPADWKYKSLKEINSGVKKSIQPSNFPGEIFHYYSIPAYQNNNRKPYKTKGGEIKSSKLLVENGDVIYGKLNPSKPKIWLVDLSDGTLRKISSSEFLGVRTDPSFISPEYVYQFLLSKEFSKKMESFAAGSTNSHQRVSPSAFYRTKIPLPPLYEQKRIAEILSTVDLKIEVIAQRVTKTEELKKGLMQRLLVSGLGHTNFKESALGNIPSNWESLTFGDIVRFSGGAQPPRSTFKFEETSGYIRLIQTRDYRTSNYKTYIPEKLARKKCKVDDIMIGRYGPPIFQIFRGLCGAYNVALIKAIPDKGRLLKDYLYYYISRYDVWAFVENLSQRSGGQTGVDLEQLRKYPFPLPPIKEQSEIVQILTDIDKKIEILNEKKTFYNDLKEGLMQQLLTGKTRVSNFIKA